MKWARNMGQAGETIREGVQAMQENPAAKAAANVSTWLARINEPKTAQKYVASLGRTTLESIKKAMIEKGIPRLSQGIPGGQSKYMAFAASFYPFLQSVTDRVRAMPKATREDRIARAVAQMRGVAEYSRS